jgi:hypothetical protein
MFGNYKVSNFKKVINTHKNKMTFKVVNIWYVKDKNRSYLWYVYKYLARSFRLFTITPPIRAMGRKILLYSI